MREACSVYYSAEIAVDHITDHLPFRSTRKQWTGERRRVRFSRRKGAEKAIFSGNCLHRSVWEQEARSSSLCTSTTKRPKAEFILRSRSFFCCFRCLITFLRGSHFPWPHNQSRTENFLFFVCCGAKIKWHLSPENSHFLIRFLCEQ